MDFNTFEHLDVNGTRSSLRVVSKMALAGHHGRAVTTFLASDQHRASYASGEPLTTTIRPVQAENCLPRRQI